MTEEKKDAIFQLIICKLLLLQLFPFCQLRFSQIAFFFLNKGGKEIIPNIHNNITVLIIGNITVNITVMIRIIITVIIVINIINYN